MISSVECDFGVAKVKVFKGFGKLGYAGHEEIGDPLAAFEVEVDEVFQILDFFFGKNVAKLTASQYKCFQLGQIPDILPFELS